MTLKNIIIVTFFSNMSHAFPLVTLTDLQGSVKRGKGYTVYVMKHSYLSTEVICAGLKFSVLYTY